MKSKTPEAKTSPKRNHRFSTGFGAFPVVWFGHLALRKLERGKRFAALEQEVARLKAETEKARKDGERRQMEMGAMVSLALPQTMFFGSFLSTKKHKTPKK